MSREITGQYAKTHLALLKQIPSDCSSAVAGLIFAAHEKYQVIIVSTEERCFDHALLCIFF
jgi:hypothetical protein